MTRAKHLLRSTFIVMVLYAINKVTGFARVILVGDRFGTGGEADAFTAANQLPELFYVLVAGGALAAALIPVYTRYLNSDRAEEVKESAELMNTILTLVLIALTIICGFAALFAPFITSTILVPHFDPAQQQLTAELMRIILINTTIFGLSGVVTSILNSHQHFILPALAPIALDVGYMFGIFVLVPRMGIHGLAWGTVLSALLHLSIQIPALVKYRLKLRPKLNITLQGVREIIWLMGPRIVMLGAIQAADIFVVRWGSELPGGISGYFYAWTLMQLPETLFGTAIAIVIFPTMAEMYNAGDLAGLKQTAMTALRIIWLFTIPAAAGLILLGRPAIEFILERGEFSADSTRLVYTALVFLSFRIVAEATLEIVARMFYARHNTKTPMKAYLAWFVVNVSLTFVLIGPLGIGGIALASTLSFIFLAGTLYVWNERDLGEKLADAETLAALRRAVLSTAVMVVVILLIAQLNLSTFIFLGVAGGIGGLIYIATYWLLGGQELLALRQMVQQR